MGLQLRPAWVISLVALLAGATTAQGQGSLSDFTYQGELSAGGVPANGLYDFRFELLNVAVPSANPAPVCINNVQVVNGRFTVRLNFGSVIGVTLNGADVNLRVSVRPDTGLDCSNLSGFATLSPDQAITYTPYAGFAVLAQNSSALNGQPASFYSNAANLTGTLPDARLSSNVPRLNTANTYSAAITAPTFTGALVGNASSATNATNLNGQPASFYTNAANLTGTLADARLSTNIPRLASANAFSQPQSITARFATEALDVNHLPDINAVDTVGVRSTVSTSSSLRVFAGYFDTGGASNGIGVYSQADSSTGPSRAFWGRASGLNNYAGYFEGRSYFSGSVGIAVTNPQAPLHVREGVATGAAATANASAVFERDNANYVQILTPDANEKGLMLGSPTSGSQAGIYYTLGSAMSFRTGGNLTRMRISDAGDVGINVTTPAAKLDVGGDIKTSTKVIAPAYTNSAGEFVAPVAVASFDQFGAAIGVPTGAAFAAPAGTGTWVLSFTGYSNANAYSVIITPRGSTPIIGSQVSQGSSGITVRTFNLSGAPTAAPFNVAVYRLN